MEVGLTDESVKSLALGKVFKEHSKRITGLDIHSSGSYCITCSSEDESLNLYSCDSGSHKGLFFSKKYGIERAIFSHHSKNVLHTCTKVPNFNGSQEDLYNGFAIRYWSLHDNRYLAYFKGHRSRVTSLALNPVSDSFLSASVDDAVLLWDWKSSSTPVGRMDISGSNVGGTGDSKGGNSGGSPLVAFDPSGQVFAIAFPELNSIRMYDFKAFEKGPFQAFDIVDSLAIVGTTWTHLEFTPDGKDLLISSNGGRTYLVDSFSGDVKHIFSCATSLGNNQMTNSVSNVASVSQTPSLVDLPVCVQSTITPDSAYIVSGSLEDGSIHVWKRKSGEFLKRFEGHLSNPCCLVKFNPVYFMMASTCSHLGFWIPS